MLPHHNTLVKSKIPLVLLVAKAILAGVNTVLLVDSDRESFIRTSGPLLRSPPFPEVLQPSHSFPSTRQKCILPAAELAHGLRSSMWESLVNTWSPKRKKEKKKSQCSAEFQSLLIPILTDE